MAIPTEFSVRELADQLLAKLGSDAGIILEPLPSDDPRQRKPDISKAGELLGREPKVPLSEGLEQTIAYFREELSGAEVLLPSDEVADLTPGASGCAKAGADPSTGTAIVATNQSTLFSKELM